MEYSESMLDCMMSCRECAQECMESVMHCLEKGGPHVAPAHISLLKSCASVCDTSAILITMMSSVHSEQCGVCEQICVLCAESCEGFEDDEKMKDCAEVCRRCAESCTEMSVK